MSGIHFFNCRNCLLSVFLFCLLVQFFHSTRLVELTVGFEEREDGEVFVAQHAHYEDFAEALMEPELEDDAFADYNNALTH